MKTPLDKTSLEKKKNKGEITSRENKRVVNKERKHTIAPTGLLIPGYKSRDFEIINMSTGQLVYDVQIKKLPFTPEDYQILKKRGFMFVSDFIGLPKKGLSFDSSMCERISKVVLEFLEEQERVSQKLEEEFGQKKQKTRNT